MDIKNFGLGLHGLVTNGLLALPNGDSVQFNQPSSGDCSVVKLNNATIGSTIGADGKQLLDYALLSGDGVAGVPMGGSFIYQSPDDKRWVVNLDDLWCSGNSLGGDIVLTEFGRMVGKDSESDVPAVAYTVPISLADIGQAAPVLTSPDGSEVLSNLRFVFSSAHPSGNECVLMIEGKFNLSPQKFEGSAPLGFVLLDITGDGEPVISASVYKSRSETIGIETINEIDARVYEEWQLDGNNTGGNYWSQDPFDSEIHGYTAWFRVGAWSIVNSLTDRLLDIVYCAAGEKQLLTYDISYQASITLSPPVNAGLSVEMSATSSASATLSMSFGGEVLTITGEASGVYQSDAVFVEGSGVFKSQSVNESCVIFGDETNVNWQDYSQMSGIIGSFEIGGEILTLSWYQSSNSMFAHKSATFGSSAATDTGDVISHNVTINNPARELTGLLVDKTVVNAPTHSFVKYGMLSPVSGDQSEISTASQFANPYGTHHPMTGQIIWDEAEPVCFV